MVRNGKARREIGKLSKKGNKNTQENKDIHIN